MTKEFVPKLKYLELLSEYSNAGITTKDAVKVIEADFDVSQESASMALKRLVRQGCARRRRIFEGATFEFEYFISDKGLGRMEFLQEQEERTDQEIIEDLEDEILRIERTQAGI